MGKSEVERCGELWREYHTLGVLERPGIRAYGIVWDEAGWVGTVLYGTVQHDIIDMKRWRRDKYT